MSLVILLSVFMLTCPNNSLPLDGKCAESRHIVIWQKKKRVRATKGIRKPRTPLPNATISCWKLQLQTHSVESVSNKNLYAQVSWETILACTTLVGKCRSRLAPGHCPGMHEISKASRQVQPYSLRAGASLALRLPTVGYA
jgi:hypothetical protein